LRKLPKAHLIKYKGHLFFIFSFFAFVYNLTLFLEKITKRKKKSFSKLLNTPWCPQDIVGTEIIALVTLKAQSSHTFNDIVMW